MLLSDPPSDTPVLDATQRQAIILAAHAKFGPEAVAPILQTIFPSISLQPGTSLVQALIQLGPEITSDTVTVRALLARFGITPPTPPTDAQVVEIVQTLARRVADTHPLCDVGALVRALSSYGVPLNWAAVIRAFDWPDRQGVDTATLKLVIAILVHSPREAEHPAVAGFWMTWANPLSQLRLLDALLSLPSDTFNFVTLPGRRVVKVDDVAGASPTIKALAANVQGHTWNSLDLFETMVRLGVHESPEVRACVHDMLDKAVKISAELVHMGLLQVPKPWNELQVEYATKLLNMFLAGHPNHQLVFMRIWQIDPTYLTTAFRDFYAENPLNITRILDVAQDLKILDALLDVRPFIFALDVAALASRREYLNLDKWLADNIAQHGATFLRAVIDFLDVKTTSEKNARVTESPEPRTMALNAQTIAIFLRVLRNSSSMLAQADIDYCLEIRNACLQVYPRLMNLAPGSDQEPGFSVVSYSQEVETEVDSIYKKMYEDDISIDQVIVKLQAYKESTNTREHEIFSCMLHFLFDEYKFFQTYYPHRELGMTAYLFGSLIQHRLIDYIPLGIAIRYVLDALQCPPESNLFQFGAQALERFVGRLREWQPLCQALLRIPHFVDSRPDLAEAARRALTAGDSNLDGMPPGVSDLITEANIIVFTAIQSDPLDDVFEEPPEEVSDRILFIINNLAPSNFESKLQEMKERFADDFSRWLAHYLVDQRVSSEPNNHALYLRFLDGLEKQGLMKLVIHETIMKSAMLLNAEKTMSSPSERSVLKNLASWLGELTLARNQPIKHKNIAFKELLLEGYDNGRLILAIPFVCKILEACAKSKVFQPPNPWLMAVIALLSELYHFADIKLNLRFEIEVLWKKLDIDGAKIEPTLLVRNRPMLEAPTAPGFGQAYDVTTHTATDTLSSLMQSDPTDNQRAMNLHIEELLASLSNTIVINPQLAPLQATQAFKGAVTLAVDRSVREIILPVVERSVTIAGISTRELVTKDFAMEGDEQRMRIAAQVTATKLAGSLALVTCKEPLRSNLTTHIRNYLLEHGFTEQMVPDMLISLLVNDNIEQACKAIEQAAMDRAKADVDDSFMQAFETRRRHREHRPGGNFWDQKATLSTATSNLPDALRIRPGGLSQQQMHVYEEFGTDPRRSRLMISRPGSTTSFGRNDGVAASNYGIEQSVPDANDFNMPLVQNQVPAHLGPQEAMERFTHLMVEVDAVLNQAPAQQTFSMLPQNHPLRTYGRQIESLAAQLAKSEETLLNFSQRVVHALFKVQTQLGRDFYAAMLERLCRTSEKVAQEALLWLLYAEDERKFSVPVIATLLRAGLIPALDQDIQLAKMIMRSFNPTIIDFTVGLLRQLFPGDGLVQASQKQFQYSFEALKRTVQLDKATEACRRLVDDVYRVPRSQPLSAQDRTRPDQAELTTWFLKWVQIFQRSATTEKSFVTFIQQLQKEGILSGDEQFSFFRVCAEASVESYRKQAMTGNLTNIFQPIDALSRLIALLIKYHGDTMASTTQDHVKVKYLSKILTIIVLVLAHAHEKQGADFQQKPFFRFFSSFLNDLHSMESNLGTAYFQILITLSDNFSTLQPTFFPGFAFSWITLISHRLFMPKLLLSENREGWSAFHKLVICLFKFLASFLRPVHLSVAVRDLYRGAMRLLVVLLHDFPEFLGEYYFTICDVIPPRCIQLRNVVLSAYPATLVLPDPHLRNVKFESLPDMGPIPPILSDFTSTLKTGDLRNYLDQFLLNRANSSTLPFVKECLRLPDTPDPNAEKYNLSAINALVMYVGVSSVAQAKARSGSSVFVPSDPGVVILQYLVTNLDAEGQYHVLSAAIMHLRYPNAHTHWYSSLLLFLFAEINDERFREIMTRALLERFIVHRPHPWGAMVTFIELLRNPRYDFWNHEFVRVAPEIQMLLEGVKREVAQM
ncbi:Not1-domain-containing protein [Exidia glandulosa HHB12029]|uniref:General negative regulator of transcription subunit 1 n=1 Tax=Exidia glandulosa HHB12029 TaxID=1314781 RepID=A0A165IYY7_EXIGL|nr:Not1-domain-containing protein [Exidia glandulosa HHB12029]